MRTLEVAQKPGQRQCLSTGTGRPATFHFGKECHTSPPGQEHFILEKKPAKEKTEQLRKTNPLFLIAGMSLRAAHQLNPDPARSEKWNLKSISPLSPVGLLPQTPASLSQHIWRVQVSLLFIPFLHIFLTTLHRAKCLQGLLCSLGPQPILVVSKKKSLEKSIKTHPGKTALGERCATAVSSKKLNDACKKKVFSPPSPTGRPISLAAEPAPWHMAHQPRLTIAFFILQVTPKCFPLCHPAMRRAQCHASVSEDTRSLLPDKPARAQGRSLKWQRSGDVKAELCQADGYKAAVFQVKPTSHHNSSSCLCKQPQHLSEGLGSSKAMCPTTQ